MTNEELNYIRKMCINGDINESAWKMIFQHCRPEERRDTVDRSEVLECLWEIESPGEMLRVAERIKNLRAVAPVSHVVHENDVF